VASISVCVCVFHHSPGACVRACVQVKQKQKKKKHTQKKKAER